MLYTIQNVPFVLHSSIIIVYTFKQFIYSYIGDTV